jgi:hypothetical protein
MRHLFKALGLLLLLLTAQQGAVVHELSHYVAAGFGGLHSADVGIDAGGSADAKCSLCPAFAQVLTPAFSHSFQSPRLVRGDLQRSPEARYEAIEAAVPTPRSRGPPPLS